MNVLCVVCNCFDTIKKVKTVTLHIFFYFNFIAFKHSVNNLDILSQFFW